MAARKKASKKGSGTVTKKTKAPVGSTASRKRKASAAPAARRTAARSKTARNAKAKMDKNEAKRRAAASAAAKRRATRSAAPVEAVKPAAKSSKAAVAEAVKPAAKPAPEVKAVHAAVQPPRAAAVAPVKPVAPAKPAAPLAKPVAPLVKRAPVVEPEVVAAKPVKPIAAPRPGFKVNEFVVYPAHGVGQIVAVEEQEVAGFRLELFVINFAKDKMTLRVPTSKVVGVGMRKLSEPEVARKSLEILTGRARIKRTMWSRRAQEYEAKINSGDINAIAEVVRDLYRSEAQPEQSYSERQLYEAALDRIMREIAAVQKLSEIDAMKLIESHLKKSQRRAAKAEGVEGDEAAVEEAA
jgi:CarD family transcriptional regulator